MTENGLYVIYALVLGAIREVSPAWALGDLGHKIACYPPNVIAGPTTSE